MAHDEDNSRPSSKHPCTYWDGTQCTAANTFAESSISCYHEGNCDGFGTCRGCSRYDRGGLKFGTSDGDGGTTQTPMNLKLYNIRAKAKPCCFWDDDPGEFSVNAFGVDPHYTTEVPVETTASGSLNDKDTSCILAAAGPWQVPFTEKNPTAYGCNGAKSECPFYTGPKFTELVDAKMDTGDRITAKQVLELRFHSADWASFENPREEYEKRFENPDIWAWGKEDQDPESASLPTGRLDEFGQPLVQKVSIDNLTVDTPTFTVGAHRSVSTGTPTVTGPPEFPDLIRDLDDASTGMHVVWPNRSSADDPFIRKTFTQAEMSMWVSVQVNSSRDVVAINLTKHPQNEKNDSEFVTDIKQNHPSDVIIDLKTGLPGSTFPVPLVLDGHWDTLNHIRIFLETGASDGSMLTADVFVRHIFYHAEVAQTSFLDKFGHRQVDPWINHFTDLTIEAEFKHLTGNTGVHDVLWNTVASNGKKTMYAIETVEEVTGSTGEEGSQLEWYPLDCNTVVCIFNDVNVNRVYPWAAWGKDSNNSRLYVELDRSGNDLIPEGQETVLELELAFASTKGLAIPPNMAIFNVPKDVNGSGTPTLDKDKDVLNAKYAYTEYKQGPITPEDEQLLKFKGDATKIIDDFVYDSSFSDTDMRVEGTYLKLGNQRLRSCEEMLGDCYTEKAAENESLARTVFVAGGVGEASIKTVGAMINECRLLFDAKYAGLSFSNGDPVDYSEAAKRLRDMPLREGSQHYNVIFKDEEGRPVGTKRVGFVTQSSHAQTRDVEIKFKWGAHMQHYPTRPQMLVHAYFHEPTFATRERLIKVLYEYDTACGDHTETTIGRTQFTAFDIETDKRGALWYPYKQCTTPRYHVGFREWWSPYNYTNTVEGFTALKRPNYWERMRFFDQYTPSIMNVWGQIGCFFGEYTTTANAHRPVVFTGYTKIRSDHAFGPYATDREAVRISRHWEKRSTSATAEIIKQEEGGLTIQLTDEYRDVLYDENLDLKAGAQTATPIWMHISDDFTVVKPTTEELPHPFGRYLLSNVGSYSFGESFGEDRLALPSVFTDRDYTSNAVRATDGTIIHITEETKANTPDGELYNEVGSELRWVFDSKESSWAWLASPPQPDRDTGGDGSQITGLHLTNVGVTFFKKSKESATHPEEGQHTLRYTPHAFTASGTIDAAAMLSMDGGPSWNISQTDGLLYVTEGSPYLTEEHVGEDYQFALFGNGPGGTGLLADNRGLQYYEGALTSSGTRPKYSTYAGVNISLLYDINELPHTVLDINRVTRLNDGETAVGDQIRDFSKEYPVTERAPLELQLDFKGHYFVEEVIIDFKVGKVPVSNLPTIIPDQVAIADIPTVRLDGFVKEEGVATISGTVVSPSMATEVTLGSSGYTSGAAFQDLEDKRLSYGIRQRLFNLTLSLGSRLSGRRMVINKIQVKVRDHVEREETITTYEPRVQISTANTGTHKPSDLEFYFQRETPDFAKSYQLGHIALADLDHNTASYSVTQIPGVEVKWLGRQIKDLIPMYNFTNFEGLFPYDNIDISAIDGYVEGTSPAGQTLRYLAAPVLTSSKGWTVATTRHFSDPSASQVSTDSGPDGVPNVEIETWPNEDLQAHLYDYAATQIGNTTVYDSFWHPAERDFFETEAGIDLNTFNWKLTLTSTVAPLDRVFRADTYGCEYQVTNEDLDGKVHRLSTWQAKGVFHYLCDPRWSWACLAVVMNKCNEVLHQDYGSSTYLDNNIVDRFSYKFEFPPRDTMAYRKAGLINQNEEGGFIGGTGGVGVSQAAAGFPTLNQVKEKYQSELYITGEQKYQ